MSRIRPWIPVVLFAAVIWTASTETFGSAHTSQIIVPILRWLLPFASPITLDNIHFAIRKSAHVSEYFVFSVLLFRAVRGARRGWRLEWGLGALAIAAAFACSDEFHQIFVPGRGASVHDVLILWWLLAKRISQASADVAPEAP
jgi:VanZ family protein